MSLSSFLAQLKDFKYWIDIHGMQEIILLVISWLHELEFICLHTSIAIVSTVKWFQVLLSNTYNIILYKSFACTQWNGYKYCYLQLHISHFLTHS